MQIMPILKHALMITLFVFVMMLLVDFINMASKGRISGIIKGGQWRQYTLASFLGSTPGCLGAFMNVSLYVHGFISFGAIVGGMIATSGDEAFVMLSEFPVTAMALFGLLFVSGIVFAWISDFIVGYLEISPSESCVDAHCKESLPGSGDHAANGTIFRLSNFSNNFYPLSFTRFLLILLIGFFLVLTTNGHGMLPLLTYSLRDSILIKAFNLFFGLAAGGMIFILGF